MRSQIVHAFIGLGYALEVGCRAGTAGTKEKTSSVCSSSKGLTTNPAQPPPFSQANLSSTAPMIQTNIVSRLSRLTRRVLKGNSENAGLETLVLDR
ncbi:hypothetical protein DFJ43DRAFT_63226 [Lentinula guzmanii]|uniref:Uncharacterized protein n=1 Tax=Lentinula guzmanii TaxID=2804957 RepID=A0AA38JH56_9AGAR|nr:hypothetical protein DFJ43DRAFT_63226 [Lentinula guzmanii]